MKIVDKDKLEITPFVLKLPDELTFKPAWEVDLPSGHKASIYEATEDRHRMGETPIVGWRVVIRNKAGVIPQSIDYEATGTFVSDKLTLAFYLERVVRNLSKTKRTRVTESDMSDED